MAARPAVRGAVRASVLGAICGVAAWATLGVLDAFPSAGGPTRVALLPGLPLLLLLVAAGAALLALVARRLATRAARLGDPHADRSALDALLPLSATALLVVPYLPWLPDALPVLTALAGPGRWLIWGLVLAQTARSVSALWTGGRSARRTLDGRRARVGALIAGILVSSFAASRLASTPLYPSGDEPHYLIIAQSLWKDGDLRIEDNHRRGDHREYFTGEDLTPHYLRRGTDGEIYSIHPIGLPLLLAPIYGAGGYLGVLVGLVLAAAAGGALVWLWLKRLGHADGAAWFAWLAVYLSAPYLLQSFAVYPEATAGLTAVVAMFLATSADGRRGPPAQDASRSSWWNAHGRWLGAGAACGWLPWLSSKYALMAGTLLLVALGRIWLRETGPPRRDRVRESLALLVPFTTLSALWLGFFAYYWGAPSPAAPYGTRTGTELRSLHSGALGIAFDQEYGAVVYAPVFLLAAAGLFGMWRAGGRDRRLALELAAPLAALAFTVGAFRIWWGGSSSPGRPIVSGVLLLAAPIAWHWASMRAKPFGAAVQHLLLFASIAVTATLVLAQQGLLINNDRDGVSNLFAYLSPLWSPAALAPSFIAHEPLVAVRALATWVIVGAAVLWVAARLFRRATEASARGAQSLAAPGGAALAATLAATAVVVLVSLVTPAVMGGRVAGDVDLRRRARVDLLERFDASRLPTALVFDSMRSIEPAGAPPLFPLFVEPPPPERGRPRRPERLLYGRRLVLPAGRYRVEVAAPDASAPVEGTLSVQLGRRPPPYEEWRVTARPAGTWTHDLDLGTDVSYAGFKASPEFEDARPVVRVHPLRILDASARARHPQVTGAARFPEASAFFTDENFYSEPNGFWVQRGRSTTVVLATPGLKARGSESEKARGADGETAGPSLRLRAHCGPVANVLTAAFDGRAETLQFGPGEGREMQVPLHAGHALVRLSTSGGFVPAEIDPGNGDRRSLGCWIEVIR